MMTVYFLISYNQAFIRELAIKQINSRIKGTVMLGSITPAFFKAFPDIAVNLHDLTIRDSLWEQHQKDFLKAKNIYLFLSWTSLFKGKPEVRKVSIEDGHLHLYTDGCGYRNLNLVDQVDSQKGEGPTPVLTLRRTRVIMENELLNALHDIEIDYLHSGVTKHDSAVLLDLDINSLVHGVGFNLDKGSYLKEKTLQGNLMLTYLPHQRMELTDVNLNIGKHPFVLKGAIYFDRDTMAYSLGIYTKQILYPDAVSLLTSSIQQHFDSISLSEPFDVEATVVGQMARKVVPAIATRFVVKDATMETPIGPLEKCSYSGSYLNQVDCQSLPGDSNSKFTFTGLKAHWNDIPLTSCHLEISNLIHPILSCDLQSVFELSAINKITGSPTLEFSQGKGNIDITYNGLLGKQGLFSVPGINGNVSFSEAQFRYVPRNISFRNCSGAFSFHDKDLILRQLHARTGNTELTMKGHVLNFLSLLHQSPERLIMDWTISSNNLHLGDFLPYIGKPSISVANKTTGKNKIIRSLENVEHMLRRGTVRLTINAERLNYMKFIATNVKATVVMAGNEIALRQASLNHAGGTVGVRGSLANGDLMNTVKISSTITKVDIPGLFRSFDNFGQDGITADNMKGQLSAKAKFDLVLDDKAKIKENTMQGEIDFSVKNGELINFEPLVKITTTALKNRDFSHIRFAELQNRFSVRGSSYTIPRMEIRANVVVLFVEGIYDSKKGTDMSIQVPVSNLSRAEHEIMENTGKAGMNIRLRAKTGTDGKLNISWDPLNRASKKRKAAMEKESVPE